MMTKKTHPILLSGIQPSGTLNIGNYLGALKNWAHLQEQYRCFFPLVDLHAISVEQDPEALRKRSYDLLALYIACGIDPKNNTLFVQSHVPQHSELAWLLNCFTHMGELNRMTQFKDKSAKNQKNINLGLFAYPVLMAADILLYDTDVVPVGEDQRQHLELARNIAIRFNNRFGEIFTVPEPYIAPLGKRIMGLQDPTKKMSKSDTNLANMVALLDPPATIIKKLKRAVTDSGSEVRYDAEKPGVSNLLTIFAGITDRPIEDIEKDYVDTGYGAFKSDLADALVQFLEPIQNEYTTLREDEAHLHAVLSDGAQKASAQAQDMLNKVHDALGFIPR